MAGVVAKILRFKRLNWRDQCLLVSVALLLCVVRLVFLGLPFPLIRRRFRGVFQCRGNKVIGREPRAWRILWAVETASRYLPCMNHCLTKAVVAKVLLNRHGFDVDLQIGITRTGQGKFEAHAWLESEGRVILGNLNNLNQYMLFSHVN
jgi:hypothetical protein